MVSDDTGLNMLEVEKLDIVQYLLYRRDAFIYKMSQTEKGREYLDNAYRLEQTAPDRKSLRDQFGEEGNRGEQKFKRYHNRNRRRYY